MIEISFFLLSLICAGLISLIAYEFGYLTESGFYGAMIFGTLIFFFLGIKGAFPLLFFFFSANLFSEIRNKKSRRNLSQVIANGILPLIFSCLWYFKREDIYFFLFLVSIGTAISDTWSTEIGMRFEKAFDIKEFKWKPAGFEGGISWQGLLGGLAGAIFAGFFAGNLKFAIYITFFSFFGNILDSLIGRFIETKFKPFTTNWTNFSSALFSSLIFLKTFQLLQYLHL